jgi:hypothetical protein
LRIENIERKKDLKDALSKARESQLVIAALMASGICQVSFLSGCCVS